MGWTRRLTFWCGQKSAITACLPPVYPTWQADRRFYYGAERSDWSGRFMPNDVDQMERART